MLTVSSSSANVINSNGRRFKLKIVNSSNREFFPLEADIVFPFSPNSLTFGAVSSSSISFKLQNSPFVKGEKLKAFIAPLLNGSPTEWIPFGSYKIDETKSIKNGNIKISTVKAYDALYFIDDKVVINLPSGSGGPAETILELISNQLGLDVDGFIHTGLFDKTLINFYLFSGYKGRDALSFLASYVGCNLCIDPYTNSLYLKGFNSVNYDYFNANRTTPPQFADSDTEIQFLIAKTGGESSIKVIKSGITAPKDGIIYSNPGADENKMKTILDNISPLNSYRVATVTQVLGDPRIQVGDCLTYRDAENNSVIVPVMQLSYHYDGGLSAVIESYAPNESQQLTIKEKIDFALETSKEASTYAETAIDFSRKINSALGLYTIQTIDSEGGSIVYLANKPNLEDATYIAVMTASGFAFTENWQGEDTVWTYGVDSSGTAIFKLLIANKVKADMIDAKGLRVTEATIATWLVKNKIIYSKATESVSGVGMCNPESNNNFTFYSGYTKLDKSELTETQLSNYDSRYEGSPLEYTANWKERTKFYVLKNGKMVAKEAEIQGSFSSEGTDQNGHTNKVAVEGGLLNFYTQDSDKNFFRYCMFLPYYDRNVSQTKPLLRLLSGDESSGVMISPYTNNDFSFVSYYIQYKLPVRGSTSAKSSYHRFLGGSIFAGTIYAENASVVSDEGFYIREMYSSSDGLVEKNVAAITLGSTGNLVIGDSTNQRGSTVIKNGELSIYDLSGSKVVNTFKIDENGSLIVGDQTKQRNHTIIRAGSNKFIYLDNYVYMRNGSAFGFYDTKSGNYVSTCAMTTAGASVFGASSQSGPTYIYAGSGQEIKLRSATETQDGVAVTSDERLKNSIEGFTETHERFFNRLSPKTFKYNNGNSGRTHFGFIAQDVKKAFEDEGLTSEDIAAFVEVKNDDIEKSEHNLDTSYCLRYNEFVALNTHMIQKCLTKISCLEEEIRNLKEEIDRGKEC